MAVWFSVPSLQRAVTDVEGNVAEVVDIARGAGEGAGIIGGAIGFAATGFVATRFAATGMDVSPYHCLIPPWREQAPRLVAVWFTVPSLQSPVALPDGMGLAAGL